MSRTARGKRKTTYKRILLKLSGEMLGGVAGKGLDMQRITDFCRETVEVARRGVQVAVVIGGGNIIRGDQAVREFGLQRRASADYMGMLATLINALALQDALEGMGAATRVLSAIEARAVCEPYIRRRATRHLEKGRIVILAGGTGHPYFSTDTTAALRALEIHAEVLLKATKVDGVYSDDPIKNPKAVRYAKLSYQEVVQRRLHVMDTAAVALCMENKMPILVFSVQKPGNIMRAVMGEGGKIGTIVN